MKKACKVAICTIGVVLFAWFILSWIDVVADNCKPNPQHSKYNVFVLATQQEEDESGSCGSPLTEHTRIMTGIISEIDNNDLTIITVDDGEAWTVEVGYGENFSTDDYLCVFFDTMGTESIYDDEIVKLWKEVW